MGTATTEIYTDCHTLSLHDALPICARQTLNEIATERRGPIIVVRHIIDVDAEGDRRVANRDDIARAEIETGPFGQDDRVGDVECLLAGLQDRKSTRLNSSH